MLRYILGLYMLTSVIRQFSVKSFPFFFTCVQEPTKSEANTKEVLNKKSKKSLHSELEKVSFNYFYII